jgi:hypothetical protein
LVFRYYSCTNSTGRAQIHQRGLRFGFIHIWSQSFAEETPKEDRKEDSTTEDTEPETSKHEVNPSYFFVLTNPKSKAMVPPFSAQATLTPEDSEIVTRRGKPVPQVITCVFTAAREKLPPPESLYGKFLKK